MTSNSVDKALGLHLCSGILARMCFRLPHDYIVLHGADNANVLPDILVLWVRSVVAGWFACPDHVSSAGKPTSTVPSPRMPDTTRTRRMRNDNVTVWCLSSKIVSWQRIYDQKFGVHRQSLNQPIRYFYIPLRIS